jgi:hypothetical protein
LCCVPPIDDAKKYEVPYAHHPHTLLLVKGASVFFQYESRAVGQDG